MLSKKYIREFRKEHQLITYKLTDSEVAGIMDEMKWLKEKFTRAGSRRRVGHVPKRFQKGRAVCV